MKELWVACRRGLSMGRQVWSKWLNLTLTLFTLAALLSSPWSVQQIDSLVWRILAWIFILLLVIGGALSIGLIPYWGQKEITKEHDQHNEAALANSDKNLNDWREKANRLESENERLKQSLSK
jgi:hypothetical protein